MDNTFEVRNFIYECFRFFLRLNDLPCDLEDSSPCALFNEDVQRVLMYIYNLLEKNIKLIFLDNEHVCFATEKSFVNIIKTMCSGILCIGEDWVLFLYSATVVTIAAVTAAEKNLPEFVRAVANAVSEDISKSYRGWVERAEEWEDLLSFCKGITNKCINTDSEEDTNQSCVKQPRRENVQDIWEKVETSESFWEQVDTSESFIRKVKLLSTLVENTLHLILSSTQLLKDESNWSDIEKYYLATSEKLNKSIVIVSDKTDIEKLKKFLMKQKHSLEIVLSDLSVLKKTLKSIDMKVASLYKHIGNTHHFILALIQLQKNEFNWSDMEKSVNVESCSTISGKPNENVDTVSDEVETEELKKLLIEYKTYLKKLLSVLPRLKKLLNSVQIKSGLLEKNTENKQYLLLPSIRLQKDGSNLSDIEKSAFNVESCSTVSEKHSENVNTITGEVEIDELEKLVIEQKNYHKRILSDFSVFRKNLKCVQIQLELLQKYITINCRIYGLEHSQTVSKESKNLEPSLAVSKNSGNVEESRVVLEKIIKLIDLCLNESETGKRAKSIVGKLKNRDESDAELQSLLHIRKKVKK